MANEILRSFRFQVKLHRSPTVEEGTGKPSDDPGGTLLGDGGFQECTGLEIEMDVQEYQEGGRNDGVIRRAGRAKYSPLTLKRGMFFRSPACGRLLATTASCRCSMSVTPWWQPGCSTAGCLPKSVVPS
jgi:hypothetical protein